MSDPLAYHLTWRTYGTWLPGDDRGHWSPLFDFYGHVVEKGGKLNRSDLMTTEACRERMKESSKVLDAEERIIVAAKIGEVVREHGIEVYAAAIESTHDHLSGGAARGTCRHRGGTVQRRDQ